MKRTLDLITPEQRDRIAAAVAAAESKTSAEIVPVVAALSGRYDRSEDLVGILTGLVCLSLAWAVFPLVPAEFGSWDAVKSAYELPLLLGAFLAGYMVAVTMAARWPRLHRFFTPRAQMREETTARARQVFFDNRVYRTAAGTGVLLYLSLYERTAVVLAGDPVMEKLGQEAIDEVCAELTSALRAGDLAEALCATLEDMGERLGRVLPRAEGDVNELPNTLVLMK